MTMEEFCSLTTEKPEAAEGTAFGLADAAEDYLRLSRIYETEADRLCAQGDAESSLRWYSEAVTASACLLSVLLPKLRLAAWERDAVMIRKYAEALEAEGDYDTALEARNREKHALILCLAETNNDAPDRDALLVRFIEGQYHAGLDYEARQNADLARSRYRYALTHCDMLGNRRERERLADLIEKAEYRLFREHPEPADDGN